MSEKPILFSTEMVNAILEGRKTQTRRVIKPQPVFNPEFPPKTWIYDPDGKPDTALAWRTPDNLCGVAFSGKGIPGDTLWVRETWGVSWQFDHLSPSQIPPNPQNGTTVLYKATDAKFDGKWRPSIFMPRWASRITLAITAVRVERVHDISETDCIAEGITDNGDGVGVLNHKYGMQKTLYAELWDTINGKKHPWQSNPWVWVVEFEVMK